MRIKNLLILFIVTLVIQQNLTAQIIWEDNRSMIYPFLDRMADKGIIELNDVVQPISQKVISTFCFRKKRIGFLLERIPKSIRLY